VKPVEAERLGQTVQRLKERLSTAPGPDVEALIEQLAARLDRERGGLRWIHASVGHDICMIAVDDVDYLRSDDKYTMVAWRAEGGRPAEALIRTPLKELVEQLDARHFVQVHRSVVVNRRSISHVTRGENETAAIHLRGRPDVLPVSRGYAHLFKQM
jgi:DNA-binding LytR/AlgR family response regulator